MAVTANKMADDQVDLTTFFLLVPEEALFSNRNIVQFV